MCNYHKKCRDCNRERYYVNLVYPCKCNNPVCDNCIKNWSTKKLSNDSKCPECNAQYKWRIYPSVDRKVYWFDWVAAILALVCTIIFTEVIIFFTLTVGVFGCLYNTFHSDGFFMWYVAIGCGGLMFLALWIGMYCQDYYEKIKENINRLYAIIWDIAKFGFVAINTIIFTAIIFHLTGGIVVMIFEHKNSYPIHFAECNFVTRTLCLTIDGITFVSGLFGCMMIFAGISGLYLFTLWLYQVDESSGDISVTLYSEHKSDTTSFSDVETGSYSKMEVSYSDSSDTYVSET